jgi:general secretion pathway protein A
MYTQFFNLKQAPFSIAPDPRYLFMSERHREALAHLLYGVDGGGGFVLLTGEIGAGKTTVCRCFIEQIPENCQFAYIFNPSLSVTELLQTVCDEFGIGLPVSTGTGVKAYVDAINDCLLRSHAQGKNNVLIIDEAQNLSPAVLEQLRLLTNLETNQRKLLQIILIGQPELREMLARPELEQLAQRVIARYHLGSLSARETASYVGHRLALAGSKAALAPFPRGLLQSIHRLSKGVPRRINLLCDRALLGAYALDRHQVTSAILRQAAAEVFAAPRVRRWPPVLSGGLAGILAGVLIAGAAAWQWLPRLSVPAAPAQILAPTPPSQAAQTVAQTMIAPAPSAPIDSDSDSASALRELAAMWGQALPAGEPCQAAARLNLRCHRGKGGLDELRLLDRPAMLVLRGDPAPPSYALLTSLNDDAALLRIGGQEQLIRPAALAARFDGEFLTFWRAPRGWRDEVSAGDRGADVDWLARRLAQMHGQSVPLEGLPLDAGTLDLLRRFQLDQKLATDGVAGPRTFIRLMHVGGAKEPHLSTPRAKTAGRLSE